MRGMEIGDRMAHPDRSADTSLLSAKDAAQPTLAEVLAVP
jgi:hypothetical protein